MSTVTLEEAQAHLAELIGRLAPGEEVTLTRDDRPVATLKAAPTDDTPEYLRQYIPPPGTVTPYWKPQLTPDGWQQVQQLLAEMKRGGRCCTPFDSLMQPDLARRIS